MAPTTTARLCVVGRVGRYLDKRCVGESPERASVARSGVRNGKREKRRGDMLILIVFGGRWSTTGFCHYGSKEEKEKV